jgi:hypothetical protein
MSMQLTNHATPATIATAEYPAQVDFMIIGAQKCGTTNLAAQLSGHREVCFCRVKEPGYFHQAADWRAGLDDYHQLYRPVAGQICGEASTLYTFFPEWRGTHERLHAYNPALKLIYIMRHPVKRVLSNYTHNVVRGLERKPPEEAVFSDPGYVNRSRYGVQIKPYLELFPRTNVLLLIFEEYVTNQAATLQRVAEFLQIDPNGYETTTTAAQHKSVGEYYLKYDFMRTLVNTELFRTMRGIVPASVRQSVRRQLSNKLDQQPEFSPALQADLWRLLADDVCAIEEILGRRIESWQRP